MFKPVSTINEFHDNLVAHRAVLAYFSHEHCSVCKVLKPKLDKAMADSYPEIHKVYIDIQLNTDIAEEYQVKTVPVVLLFLEEREFIRKTRTFSVKELIGQIERPYRLMTE